MPGRALSRRHPRRRCRKWTPSSAPMSSSRSCRSARACRSRGESARAVSLSRPDAARAGDARHFAYIKIAEGCDHPCTFCVIPQYRGTFRSRRFESVIAEATRLFEQGVREINLIGQDTTCLRRRPRPARTAWRMLLARLAQIETPMPKSGSASSTPIPTRSRRSCWTPSPSIAALVKYIDMPLQHASAPVLKRMKRGASATFS